MAQCDFNGKVALVTGAGGGLGRQHALELAQRGAKVMVNDVGAYGTPTARVFVDELLSMGFDAECDTGSVAEEKNAVSLVERTVERFGRIDILINNAGAGEATTVQDTDSEDFEALLRVHLFGTMWTQRTALRQMRRQNYGRIVNTASALGAFGSPAAAAYVTAKSGIIGLSKAAALDNADCDIKVNVLCPIAYTPMAKPFFDAQSRLSEDRLHVRRVTPVVLFLAHENCPVTGEVLSAGLGRVARIFTATVPGYSSETLSCEEVFENVDAIFDATGYRILKSSLEQYDTVLPTD
ncbi:SDR family NAD(P)-dependent oxidoreductase [Sphingopyxis sp. GW247-27LB]|uniref:SDR family NAD(P)-dependent oxidoreductase n=1 Tax=Sphingopyxis sp. GW247-27LB TaxID=2012632 RepID=UPI000BA711F2|nr:SDR family NAD(P)-dependent oxidoreductase [Sphingopyxis sp. GW247-27LB]PAL24238.1 short-chain dehydrogenase [Sphingopyxis sp. GW247-27LB]